MGYFKEQDIDNQEKGMQLTFDFDNEPQRTKAPTKTQELAQAWVRYAQTNRLNPKSKKYHELHHAFLCGIGNALGEDTPPIISICMACGRDVASLVERTQPR